jgi:hypothetical protein
MAATGPGFIALERHHATSSERVASVGVRASLAQGRLRLSYRIEAGTALLRIPEPHDPIRRDGLWQHTCAEMFVATDPTGYYEWNFAPSGDWACYAFRSYRDRIEPDPQAAAPWISLRQHAERLEIEVALALDWLDAAGWQVPLRLALSAVIEECDGRRSYWALRHAGARPDFHDSKGFVSMHVDAETGHQQLVDGAIQ